MKKGYVMSIESFPNSSNAHEHDGTPEVMSPSPEAAMKLGERTVLEAYVSPSTEVAEVDATIATKGGAGIYFDSEQPKLRLF